MQEVLDFDAAFAEVLNFVKRFVSAVMPPHVPEVRVFVDITLAHLRSETSTRIYWCWSQLITARGASLWARPGGLPARLRSIALTRPCCSSGNAALGGTRAFLEFSTLFYPCFLV